jgi:HTH-type transcriptional regulator / antitoxin HipB
VPYALNGIIDLYACSGILAVHAFMSIFVMSAFIVKTTPQLAAHLRSLRKSRSLTQAQLGAIIGVDQTRIAKIERNPGSVSVDQLLQLLAALGVQFALQPIGSTHRPAKQNADW